MFFNSKRFEVVDLASQDVLELNASNTLTFYIKDIFSGTEILSVQYLVVKTVGRTETPQGSYINTILKAGDVHGIDYTPTGVVGDKIKFRLKVTDLDSDEHYIDSDTYDVVAGG